MLDLNELAKQSQEIAKQRAKHGLGADTVSCLKHCAGEVIESLDAYKEYKNLSSCVHVSSYSSELADIIVCALIAAANDNIDIEKSLKVCVEKNRKRAEGIGDKL